MEPRPSERGNAIPRRRACAAKASMEPRPFERGNGPQAAGCARTVGFNGATSFRTWKQDAASALAMAAGLQWSHVLPNVETSSVRCLCAAVRLLQWSHVLPNVETSGFACCWRKSTAASMEPRPFERGNDRDAVRQPSAVLQWSHVLSNVETCVLSRQPAPASLRWSHVLSNVETPAPGCWNLKP